METPSKKLRKALILFVVGVLLFKVTLLSGVASSIGISISVPEQVSPAHDASSMNAPTS